MDYLKAKEIADSVLQKLKPHCDRIEIAGSVRRQKAKPNDIEIVAIPKPYNVDLFESGIATIVNQWEKVKGELPCKYTQRILPEGIKLDLFFATPENWGNILLIRTGDWEFSKKFMGILLPRKGYKQEGGFLKHKGKIICCQEERDLFLLAGIEYIDPKERNINAL